MRSIGDRSVVAGLLDLLRIADALPAPAARRHALAYRAVLDVRRARKNATRARHRTTEDRIGEWLSGETPGGVAAESDPRRAALLRVFVDHDVAFVLIGGAALQSHGRRYDTQDIDLTLDTHPGNLARLAAALNTLSAGS